MRAIKRYFKSLLLNRGLHVSAVTEPERLRAFFNMVRPVDVGVGLMRMGGETDGGYLVPDDFEGITTCFSPGVSSVADFELALAQRGIHSFMADASVVAPPIEHPLFHFDRKFLGSRTQGDFITLDDWVLEKCPGTSDLILQMDIEGAEYDVLTLMSDELLKRFRMMIIEFHAMDRLFDRSGFDLLRLTFEKLTRHFDVVHIHPNNSQHPVALGEFVVPPVIEVTLLRRDRAQARRPRYDFPHPLDRANVGKRGDLVLPRCWYQT